MTFTKEQLKPMMLGVAAALVMTAVVLGGRYIYQAYSAYVSDRATLNAVVQVINFNLQSGAIKLPPAPAAASAPAATPAPAAPATPAKP